MTGARSRSRSPLFLAGHELDLSSSKLLRRVRPDYPRDGSVALYLERRFWIVGRPPGWTAVASGAPTALIQWRSVSDTRCAGSEPEITHP